tara:strand:- start:93163 stop:94374 length:1212 start_codon:yes stop_codon:yes gene_type:complete
LKISSSLKTLTYLTQASLVGSVASYALTIYLAGYLGTEKYGLYSYILAIAGFSTIIITYATDQTAPSLVSKGVSLQTIFNNVLSIRLLWFVLIMVILILWKWNEPVVLFGALIINLSSFNTSYYHEINRDNTKYAVIYLFERLLYVLIIVAVNLVSQVNIVTILLVYFFIVSLSLFVQFWRYRFYIRNYSISTPKNLWQGISSNLPLVIIAISTYAYGGLSRLIIEDKIGLSALGIFSSGMQLTVVATIFLAQIERVWRIPLFDSLEKRNGLLFYKTIKEWLIYSTLPISIGALFVYLFRGLIVDLLFGPEYEELKSLLPYISLFFITISLLSLVNNCWVGLNKYREFLIISVVFSLILLFVLYLLPSSITLNEYIIVILSVQVSLLAFSVVRIIRHLKILNV